MEKKIENINTHINAQIYAIYPKLGLRDYICGITTILLRRLQL